MPMLERGYHHLVMLLDQTSPVVTNVEDELALELEEPVDNNGTTTGTKFSVLHRNRVPFLVSCGF